MSEHVDERDLEGDAPGIWHELPLPPARPRPRPTDLTPADGERGRCSTCRRAVLWVETTGGKRMPVDVQVVRASRVGPGRTVNLFVDGEILHLREDPGGAFVGHEPHFGSCEAPPPKRRERVERRRDTCGRCGQAVEVIVGDGRGVEVDPEVVILVPFTEVGPYELPASVERLRGCYHDLEVVSGYRASAIPAGRAEGARRVRAQRSHHSTCPNSGRWKVGAPVRLPSDTATPTPSSAADAAPALPLDRGSR